MKPQSERRAHGVYSEFPGADLVTILRHQAQLNPDALAYIFLADGECQERSVSYGQLDTQARAIAVQLQRMGMQGERALLLYPASLDYIAAFLGCLYAGVIAVPVYPPSRHYLHRLTTIIQDATPSVVLTTEELRERLQKNHDKTWDYDGLIWIATNSLVNSNLDFWTPPAVETDSLAFLQYTSGSTGDPKGVMVSHRNLMSNQRIIQQAFGHTKDTVVVGWLPLYHDMGLIGNILQPLYLGSTAILMSPLAFLEKPIRWLKAISKYRATTSGGPNFAYELCIRKIVLEQIGELDLSCWTLAFNGSESVRASTLGSFSKIFSECGFRREAFFPCYGLAESTLFVTGRQLTDSSIIERTLPSRSDHPVAVNNSQMLVNCGHPWDGHEIFIVNPETRATCSDGEEGEIWVSGPSVAQGYWNRSKDSDDVFRASLSNGLNIFSPSNKKDDSSKIVLSDHAKSSFLRTGDLGIIQQGDLFVTGRIKDLIILRGRNYYPHDLEQSLNDGVSSTRLHYCAVFSVDWEGEESLVVVAEIKRKALREQEAHRIFFDMRRVLAEFCDAPIGELILVSPGSILKTSSGKIQRQATKQAYLLCQLNILARSSERGASFSTPNKNNEVENDTGELFRGTLRVLPNAKRLQLIRHLLISKLAKLLVVPEASLTPASAIRSMGLDSLRIVELKHAVDTALGCEISLSLFLSDYSVNDLAQIMANETYFTFSCSSPSILLAQNNPGLTCAQKAIWTVHQLEPQSIVYNLQITLRFQGNLETKILRHALEILLERNTQLRTAYRMDGESVQQILIPHTELAEYFTVINAMDWLESEIQSDLTRRIREPFDLSSGSLLRVATYQRGKHDHVLLFCAHHIAVDLWTGLILLNDLKLILQSLVSERPIHLPRLIADYEDFVKWQQSYLKSQSGQSDRDYWGRQLSGSLPILALPTDFPRSSTSRYRGASHNVYLDSYLTRSIKQLGQKYGASLFMTLLAVYNVLLYRYTHQNDIIVGTASNGRPQARFKHVVGNFVNPIALRSRPNSTLAFVDYLKQVRDTVVDALSHSDYPFSLLVEHLQPERNADHWPIYQTWFMLQQGRSGLDEGLAHLALGEEGEDLNWGEWTIASKAINEQVENFDLRLMAAENQSGLLLSFKYRTDLFEAETIARMAQHFQMLLSDIIARPEALLGELSLLTKIELTQQLVKWNSAVLPISESECLHDLFEAQVNRTPMQAAISYEGVQLTYAELNASANQLANYLREQGVRPEIVVGLCVKRSLDMVIGILGILKAGGAYVPIDPELPEERIASLLVDSKATLLITHQALVNKMPVHMLNIFCLDGNHKNISEQSKANPQNLTNPAHLAYIIYTSGSTGKPKGVAITHGNVVHSTQARFHTYQADVVEGFLLLSSYTFDSSVAGIFWTLCQGGCITLPPEGSEKDPRILGKMLSGGRITHFLCLPSLYRLLLKSIPQSCFNRLKVIVIAGEACSSDLVALHYERLPQVAFFNEYGPTEGTVWSSVHQIQAEDAHKSVSIGRPIQNVQIYLLDNYLNQVPIGVTGELYIGGTGLARGYLHNPDLTAERFIPNLFDNYGENTNSERMLSREISDSRLYRTGDLARYHSDGSIEFLGRIDYQVKIRGYRIELGEVEAQLRRHPNIKEVVVIAREDRLGDPQLVAYVVITSPHDQLTNDGAILLGSSSDSLLENLSSWNTERISEALLSEWHLREFLKRSLPDFMVPSAFVFLEALPLLLNGKINRAGLPSPEAISYKSNQKFTDPRDSIENVLMGIWKEVLNVDKPFGIRDNFFDLGGHSLLAIQVMVKIQDEFNIELPVVNIFEASTIEQLAALVKQEQYDNQNDSVLTALLDELEQLPDEQVNSLDQEVVNLREIP